MKIKIQTPAANVATGKPLEEGKHLMVISAPPEQLLSKKAQENGHEQWNMKLKLMILSDDKDAHGRQFTNYYVLPNPDSEVQQQMVEVGPRQGLLRWEDYSRTLYCLYAGLNNVELAEVPEEIEFNVGDCGMFTVFKKTNDDGEEYNELGFAPVPSPALPKLVKKFKIQIDALKSASAESF